MKMAMQIGERDVSTRPRLQDHNSVANRRRGKYAEVTSIWLKYCKGSTRFKGHLGIHVGGGGGVGWGVQPAGKISGKALRKTG